MKHYKDPATNQVYAYESDGSQDHAILPFLVAITEAEALQLCQPKRDKNQSWEVIQTERDRRKAAGIKVGTKWFHSDDSSRIQQIGLVMMGTNIPPGLQWKTMDGTFVDMTAELALQVFATTAASDQAIFAAAESHKALMEATADPSAYDFSGGWPEIFGE